MFTLQAERDFCADDSLMAIRHSRSICHHFSCDLRLKSSSLAAKRILEYFTAGTLSIAACERSLQLARRERTGVVVDLHGNFLNEIVFMRVLAVPREIAQGLKHCQLLSRGTLVLCFLMKFVHVSSQDGKK